mmetsp:Transcript_5945/g.13803  ORF Transcript_5945/g.13803 Transcript_5945/m.13803 type:complete len:244 (-) Transcript_5945:7-738(-)
MALSSWYFCSRQLRSSSSSSATLLSCAASRAVISRSRSSRDRRSSSNFSLKRSSRSVSSAPRRSMSSGMIFFCTSRACSSASTRSLSLTTLSSSKTMLSLSRSMSSSLVVSISSPNFFCSERIMFSRLFTSFCRHCSRPAISSLSSTRTCSSFSRRWRVPSSISLSNAWNLLTSESSRLTVLSTRAAPTAGTIAPRSMAAGPSAARVAARPSALLTGRRRRHHHRRKSVQASQTRHSLQDSKP